MSFFAAARPAGGTDAVCLDLADLTISLGGLESALARRLLERYAPYARSSAADGRALHVRVGLEDREYFIEPPAVPEVNPVLLACDGTRVRYLGYELAGWFDASGGEGQILLTRGRYEPDIRAFENYIRAAVAWQAASRGGALVHAASAVYKDKGFLFYGPSGAGKSTLSACNTRAAVVSDDLSLLLPRGDGGLDLVGSPFRGTYTGGAPVVGRYPLVRGYRIVKDVTADVRTVPRVRVFAELIANLPFVADAFPSRPDLFERFERTFAALPLAHLHFRKDDSYWDAIEAAGF